MMYKDRDKQKEATRERVRRYRERLRGVTSTSKSVTEQEALLDTVIGPPSPLLDPFVVYSSERWANLQSKGYEMPPEAEQYGGQLNLEGELPEGFHKGYARKAVGPNMYQFAVPVPGDPAYEGVCVA